MAIPRHKIRMTFTVTPETAELIRQERETARQNYSHGVNLSAVVEAAIREAASRSLQRMAGQGDAEHG